MQVWLRELDTGATRQLTAVTGGVRYPALAPDGRTLVFQQPGPRGDFDFTLRVLDLATGTQRKLATPPLWPGRSAPRWPRTRAVTSTSTGSSWIHFLMAESSRAMVTAVGMTAG